MPCSYSLLVLVPLNRLDIGFSENSALIMSDDDTNDGVDDDDDDDHDDDDDDDDDDDTNDDDHDDGDEVDMMMKMVANMPWVDTSIAHHNTLRWIDRYLQAANMRSKSISVKWWSIDMSSRMSTISLVRRDRT